MKIIALDHGDKRLGFAVSDPSNTFAIPLCVVELKKGPRDAVTEVVRVCREHEADKLVIGLPLNMDGTRGPMVAKVEAFVAELKKELSLPMELWDERLSTSAAESVLLDADVSRAKRRAVRDKLAAQVILQGYLDAMNHP